MKINITIGQYYNTDSLTHRLDPRLKLIVVFLFMFVVFFAQGIVQNLLIVLALALVSRVSNIPIKVLVKSVKPIAIFLLFTAIANLIFLNSGEAFLSLGPLTITSDGIWAAVFLSLRFLFLMTAGSLLALTTTPIELTDAIENLTHPLSRFGFPSHELAMVLSIAMRFIPTLAQEASRVVRAQTARGASFFEGSIRERIKAFVPILVPLFASAIRHAENLAVAMEARCYAGGEGRTHYHELKIKKIDYLAFVLFIAYVVFFFAIRVILP